MLAFVAAINQLKAEFEQANPERHLEIVFDLVNEHHIAVVFNPRFYIGVSGIIEENSRNVAEFLHEARAKIYSLNLELNEPKKVP